jgi:hypothetical protein
MPVPSLEFAGTMMKDMRQAPADFLRKMFGIDPRALAVLRIGMGTMLIWDLFGRIGDFRALYSDEGVLPRTFAIAYMGRMTGLSFHLMSGEAWFHAGLFLTAFVAAVCLAAGYRTRTATIVSWALFASICSRNARAMNAGDSLMLALLLWSCFLPLGIRHSVDALKARVQHPPSEPVVSVASAAILLQVACIYLATSLFKSGEPWRDGSALYYALNGDQFGTSLGKALLQYPGLLIPLTHLTILLEMAGPFLLLWPMPGKKFVRTLAVASFAALHTGIALTMKIGFLPILDILAVLLFLPREVWDGVYRVMRVPSGGPAPGEAALKVKSGHDKVSQVIAGVLLVYMLWWTLGSLHGPFKPPAAIRNAAAALRMNHVWNMFAPYPSKVDGWYILASELDDGRTIDLMRGGRPVDWEKPKSVAGIFPNYRHRKYMASLLRKDTPKPLIARFVRYHHILWDKKLAREGRRVRKTHFYFMEERTMPDYQAPKIQKKLLWTRGA